MKAKFVRELNKIVKMHSKQVAEEQRARKAIEEKRKVVEEAKKLLLEYRTLILIDSSNLPSRYLTFLRKKLEGVGVVKLFKNNLLYIAMKELGMANVDEFAKFLQQQNIAVFINANPFEAKLLLDKIVMPWKATPGEKIEHEIVVPSMKTDVKPGPMMSLFSKLKIPIQVRDGVIWIAKESVVARPGDTVTPELSSLFEKLGIEPKFVRASIKAAYERGVVISGDKLVLDIDAYRKDFAEAISNAINIASEIVVPDPIVVKTSLFKAYSRALRLAAESGLITKETVAIVFSSAISKAYALAQLLASKSPELAQQLQVSVVQTQTEVQQAQQPQKVEEKEEKKEGVSEEQLAEGLSALFG
ncbi:50S ribosomal protein L10 [Ignisphaera sp. 4213-co]|uniref:Large ribosomal subunit protein uL10 n=1 Tax=Ignisphaera cupida TaxID=3050454 RepID=A0ABD4Z7G7_9CREN|nr:50S ribosomal protein L10 [Ignisphaera sp. 4213-co]MDK6028533.1 50S ribosomal protein L10 [Ignisphaera sp. 4213-co]